MEPYDPVKHYKDVKLLISTLKTEARRRSGEDDVSRLECIANAVEVLNHHATRNDVTGYPGMRQRDADVAQMRKNRAEHRDLKFYVVAVDLDNFGSFNKEHGQEVGDAVLKTTMCIFHEGLREYDVVGKSYHPHGEEIDLIIQAPNDELAALVVNRLRKDLKEKSGEMSDGNHAVTGTFGFTQWNIEGEEYGVARLRADKKMSEGKREEKNRVYFAPSPKVK